MDWIIKDCGFSVEDIDYYANKFLIGNGYMGSRASLDEYSAEERACINLAGIYDRNGDTWRETVNAPNGLWISLSVNGRVIALPHTDAVEHEQWVDIKNALQGRKTVWQLEEGKLTVTSERFASMNNFHRLLVKYTVETDFDAKIEVLSGIDANIWDISNKHF
jgi:kojibiose phosphorylase/nigerose phosphorylase